MPSPHQVPKSSHETNSPVQGLVNQIALAQATELARSGKYAEAERLLKEMVQDSTTAPKTLDLLARIRAQQGKFTEAEALWMQVLQQEPGNRQAQSALRQVRRGRVNKINRLGAIVFGAVIVGLIAVLALYALPPAPTLPTPTELGVRKNDSMPTLAASTLVTVVVTTTPAPTPTPAPFATPAPTFTPQVVVVVVTPQPRWNILKLDPSPKYRVGRISCEQSNPLVWHHNPNGFTIEGIVYVPIYYFGLSNEPRNWANHKQVGGAQSSTASPRVINETEQWIERLYILPLLENGGSGTWYVWVIEDGKRVSEVAQISIDDTCRHGVVDFETVNIP